MGRLPFLSSKRVYLIYTLPINVTDIVRLNGERNDDKPPTNSCEGYLPQLLLPYVNDQGVKRSEQRDREREEGYST